MKLYGSLTSPYVRKLRILIQEKQLSIDFVAVESAADNRVATRNPLGKVPVLERDDGSALFDSPVIIEYIDALKSPALVPAAGEARWQVLRWAALSDGILDAAVLRVMESRRPEALRWTEANKHQEGKIARALAFAEQHLGADAWLVDKRQSLADIALAVALGYVEFRYPHAWRTAHPKLAQWFAVASARQTFVDTRPPQ